MYNKEYLIDYYSKSATILTFPPENVRIKGIIVLVHGMCERKERYSHILEILSRNGFICVISDLRGHGERTYHGERGYFGKNGDKKFVEDLQKLISTLKKDFPELPLILFGHSMGSLIVRSYLKMHPDSIRMLIVCGCPSNNRAAPLGKLLIRMRAVTKGWHYRSKFIKNLVTGSFDKPFKQEGIENAWLSTDPAVAEKYNSDDTCGFNFTLNGYYCLLNLMINVYSPKGWTVKTPNMPIHFISGGDDPCRVNDDKFYEAVQFLETVGYNNVTSNLYVGKRHELFNETNHLEIVEDLLAIINQYIK